MYWDERGSDYLLQSIARARSIDYPLLQSMKYEIDKHIYYYGQHFRHPHEREMAPEENLRKYAANLLRFFTLAKAVEGSELQPTGIESTPTLIANPYFSWDRALRDAGWNVLPPPWANTAPRSEAEHILAEMCSLINDTFRIDYQFLFERDFLFALEIITQLLHHYFDHPAIRALVIPYTPPFFENTATRIFRTLRKPSILVCHGVCTQYAWGKGEHEVDYYAVWGKRQRERYIHYGFPPDRVYVSGHPDHPHYIRDRFRFELTDVLVATRVMSGAPSFNLGIYQNRGDSLDHIHRIQAILSDAGIRRARLRPHPAESLEWYARFADPNFYRMDGESLTATLSRSSVVIGPASSLFIDSLLHGVQYLIFEPSDDYNPCGYSHDTPEIPFNGADPRVSVARTDEDLRLFLERQIPDDPELLADYVNPEFHPEVITDAVRHFDERRMERSSPPPPTSTP